ncbi:radical SAM protein [Actinoplanes sp. NPDC048791]|uniref:radical SAM protein n=1 Tax=Actinoplanes sp. NPDC048791 TaxID=3154623 RepID=UPI0033E32351
MTLGEKARLAAFFGRLAVKERFAPRLHVRPLVAELFLTDNCNLRCTSCGCWTSNTKGELSTQEWQDVLRQLVALRIHKVNFTGGEPLIRPDAIALMAYARSAGVRHLHLNSNGIRLTPAVLDEVIAAGVRSFNVSVDGPTALVHDRIRGRLGAFATTTEHLRHLIAQRDRHRLKVRMNFTVMRDNVDSLPAIAALAQELGVALYLNLVTDRTFLFRTDAVTDQTAVDRGRLDAALAELEELARRDRRWLPRYSDLRYLRGHFSDLVQRDLPCAESQLKLMIHSQGQVGGCWAHDPTATVRSRSLAAIVDAPEYREEHARLFRKECVGCGSNYSLNLRWRPGTYLADLRWRAGRKSLAA